MSEENPYKLFVSHLGTEDDDYLRFFEYVSEIDNFFYVNLSDPASLPPGGAREARQAEYKRQMERAEVVIILATQYVTDADGTQFQMDLAKALKKPMIAVEPFGPNPILKPVKDKVDEVVPWYNRTMVDSIRFLARGGLATRYEVLDFP